MNADADIAEAQQIARRLVEYERGRGGYKISSALFSASVLWGIDQGTLKTLWERRRITFVKSHILGRLKAINAELEKRTRPISHDIKRTAEVLEERGSPLSWAAHLAAEMARYEE